MTIRMDPVRDWVSMLRGRLLASWRPANEAEPVPEDQRTHRGRLIAELLAVQARDEKESAVRRQRMEDLGRTLQAVETPVARLREKIAVEHGRQMRDSFESDVRISKLRAALADCAPTAIDTLLERVSEEIEHWQRQQDVGPGVADRLTNLRRVRTQAEALRTAPIAMAALMTELRRLEKSLPDESREHFARPRGRKLTKKEAPWNTLINEAV